jgi:ActR/RegA family two-component response regulator
MADGGPLLVIVDSDTATAHELSHELAAVGFNVRGPARTLSAARKLIRLVVPDIALINTRLSDGENGLALAHELQARGVRVVMMGAQPAAWTGAYIRTPLVVNDVVELLAFRRDVTGAAS